MVDKIEKKYGVIVAHGILDHNLSNFIVPEGYSFVFLVRSGQESSNGLLQECDLAEEVYESSSRGYLSGDHVHEYNAGDLVQEHIITFDARALSDKLLFLTTGIYGTNETLPHEDGQLRVYRQSERQSEDQAYHFSKSSLSAKFQDLDLKEFKRKQIKLSLLCKYLKPGGYIVHICRSLPKVLEDAGIKPAKSVEDISGSFKDNTRAVTIYSRDKFKDKLVELCRILLEKNDSLSNQILKGIQTELINSNKNLSEVTIAYFADKTIYNQIPPIIISNILYLYLTSFGQFQSPNSEYHGVNGGGEINRTKKTKKRGTRSRKKRKTVKKLK